MKKQKKKTQQPSKRVTLHRTHRISFLFNDEEMKAFNHYIEKYHIKNQSRLIRETIMTCILKEMEENHPTLF